MAKKFKDGSEQPQGVAAGPISLLDYMRDYAPEVLAPLPMMQGASALRFWQECFQPPAAGEGRRLVNERWRWPYAERLVYLAREFIKLDEPCRLYVLKAASAQIWWRGDDMQRFRAIVAAHLAYRRLNEAERAAYRKRLLSAAHSAFDKLPSAGSG
jgi:hypothetical protein